MDVHPAPRRRSNCQPAARVTQDDLSSFGAGTGDSEASTQFPGRRVKHRDPVLGGEDGHGLSVRIEQRRWTDDEGL